MTATGFILRNLYRKLGRGILTFFSLWIAFILFVLLGSVAIIFADDIDPTSRVMISPKYSIIDSMPYRYVNEIRALPGVREVAMALWFGGYYRESNNVIPTFPVEPDEYFEVFTEYIVAPDELEAFKTTRTAALAPVAMVERFGWEVGSKLPIGSSIYSKLDGSFNWEFDLVGTYDMEERGFDGLLFHYEYFREASSFGNDEIGWMTVLLTSIDIAPEIANQIDTMYRNSSDPTRTAPEAESGREFLNQYGDIGLMMSGIISAVFFTILLLTANTMSQAFRERIPEIGVLKTLGFSDGKVGGYVLTEAVLLCVIPALFAVLIGFLLSGLFAAAGAFFPLPMNLSVRFESLIGSLGIAVLLGAIVGSVPAFTARRLEIVAALRST